MPEFNLVISEKYYSKDPQSSDLGKNLISAAVELLDELGFEQFTFKKLAAKINSTEASIYRYFDNKLKLLLYLTTSYWTWMEYLIDYESHHLEDSRQKLDVMLKVICQADGKGSQLSLPGIDGDALRRVVMSESDKTYLTKKVDQINKEGLFKAYKGLCHKIAETIQALNPDYKYPHALVSCVLEASHQQVFFAQHLPALTEVSIQERSPLGDQVYLFIMDWVFGLLNIGSSNE